MDLEEETPVVETKPFVETSTKSGNRKLKLINLKSPLYFIKSIYYNPSINLYLLYLLDHAEKDERHQRVCKAGYKIDNADIMVC